MDELETTIDELEALWNDDDESNEKDDEQDVNDNQNRKVRTKRSVFRRQINKMRDPITNTLVEVTPKMSVWYQTYVNNPDFDNPKFNNRFRRRFRCSYDSHKTLLTLILNEPNFDRWKHTDAVGREPSPFELLLLGTLRYLGRGWTFDDLEESTSISEECHRQFFHVFIAWGREICGCTRRRQ